MQKITPYFWFDNEAEEAARFYTSIFPNSGIGRISRYGEAGREFHRREPGSVMTVEFEIEGSEMTALNGGPGVFHFSRASSLCVNCDNGKEVNAIWNELVKGGTIAMPLQKYPFSEKFGWLTDKFGLSWQICLNPGNQKIIPCLMFAGEHHGNAGPAIDYYVSVFDDSEVLNLLRYVAGESGGEGTVKKALFSLGGRLFMAMDGSGKHDFSFTGAFSFLVKCDTQEEVDRYWEKLSSGGDENAQQCGWLKDRFGVTWQIVPKILLELIGDPNSEKSQKALNAMFQMKKIDIEGLQRAYAAPAES